MSAIFFECLVICQTNLRILYIKFANTLITLCKSDFKYLFPLLYPNIHSTFRSPGSFGFSHVVSCDMKNGHTLCALRNENFGQAGDGKGVDGMEYHGGGTEETGGFEMD